MYFSAEMWLSIQWDHMFIMKHCNHSQWLNFCNQGIEITFQQSNRLQTLVNQILSSDSQHFSLFVLIKSAAKCLTLQKLIFFIKTSRIRSQQCLSEMHLYLKPSIIFHKRSILFADKDLSICESRSKNIIAERCHKTIRQTLFRSQKEILRLNQDKFANNLYSHLLCSFADVFCFFAADFVDFRLIVCHLSFWLKKGQLFTLSKVMNSWLIIVTETTTSKEAIKKEIKRLFLSILKDETTKNISSLFSAVKVLCILSEDHVLTKTWFRLLRECLMSASNHI